MCPQVKGYRYLEEDNSDESDSEKSEEDETEEEEEEERKDDDEHVAEEIGAEDREEGGQDGGAQGFDSPGARRRGAEGASQSAGTSEAKKAQRSEKHINLTAEPPQGVRKYSNKELQCLHPASSIVGIKCRDDTESGDCGLSPPEGSNMCSMMALMQYHTVEEV